MLDTLTANLEASDVQFDRSKRWKIAADLKIALAGEAKDRATADALRDALVDNGRYTVTSTGADTEGGEQRPTGRAHDVAHRHGHVGGLRQGESRDHPQQAPGRPTLGQGGRPDGVDRLHPERPDHRPHGGHERHREPQGRALHEPPQLERRLPHGERQQGRHGVRHRPARRPPDSDTGRHAEQGDLRGHQQGAEREHARRDPQRHPDPDLATLRLDHAGDEVERREPRPEQDEECEGVPGGLVVARVLIERPVDRVLAPRRDGAAEGRDRGG